MYVAVNYFWLVDFKILTYFKFQILREIAHQSFGLEIQIKTLDRKNVGEKSNLRLRLLKKAII
jgi:hypothetical protein